MILIIATGFSLAGLAVITISFTHSIVIVLLLMLLFGAGYGLAQTAIDAQIIQLAPPDSKGGVLSIHNTMKYVGQCLSPIVLGIVLLHFNLDAVFIVAGSFGLFITLMTYLMKNTFENPGDKHSVEKETKNCCHNDNF